MSEPLSATELVAAYRAGERSPVEEAEAALARIEERDGELNAFCLVDADAALTDARASEARWARGEPAGPLDGVPVGVKDLLVTQGWPTLRGSTAIDPAGPWEDDAPVVASLRRSGAVLPGKTTTPELGWKGVTDSALTGVTRNPWDPRMTPGGSSGGSSAALAAGMVPLALGTDGGGSIRIPCAFCGLPGLKPTFGLVPAWPASPFGPVSHVGPMARTVADLALMLDVIAAPDARDWQQLPPAARSFGAGLEDGVAGLRIAFSPELGFAAVDPEIAGLVARAAFAFAALGAHVEMADPGFADPRGTFDVLWSTGAARATAMLPSTGRDRPGPGRDRRAGPRLQRRRVPDRVRRARPARDRDEPLPRAVGPAAHAGDADRRLRGRPRGPRGQRRSALARLDAVHLSVQPHPAAGGHGAVRLHLAGAPGRPADRRAPARRRPGAAGRPLLRAGEPAAHGGCAQPPPVTVNDFDIVAFELLPAKRSMRPGSTTNFPELS